MAEFRFPYISTENGPFLEAHWNELEEQLLQGSFQARGLGLDMCRLYGHRLANFYPEGIKNLQFCKELDGLAGVKESVYCQKIGFEFWPFCPSEVTNWLIEQIEQEKPILTASSKLAILHALSRSEVFETFLHTRYVGQKRFSLEGAETLIPMLEILLESLEEIDELIIGMPHRGRLNVLANIMHKSYHEIFSEFEDKTAANTGGGDVKYHKGYFSESTLTSGHRVKLWLAANPSHLESVDPVVAGIARARQKKARVLPLLIHGDASLAGQGVVYETLQLAGLAGYTTGGTIHIVNNNHIGFTTRPVDFCGTSYCTDIAKAFGIPVFHVSAEDPESCIWVTKLAFALRQKFHIDVFIDVNSYRKYGHNESDEPAFTQPLLYQIIRSKQSVRTLYHDALIQEGIVSKEALHKVDDAFKEGLQKAQKEVQKGVQESPDVLDPAQMEPESIQSAPLLQPVLEKVVEALTSVPEGFTVHPRIAKTLEERKKVLTGAPLDWAFAESIAFGTLLDEGVSIRLTGQDTRRGTFSQRHGVWVDQQNDHCYYPLQSLCQSLCQSLGVFELIDSPLSEFAALGFEYGYSLGDTEALVLWEAQFGDFVNGAQVIIDQYIASGQEKWGAKSRLVLLLPHGYEGQGPEHSSGRMDRFLALCAGNNMCVANLTTPSQLFHLLRLHAHATAPKPLILFTPKGLLRHPKCISYMGELLQGSFCPVLDDPLKPYTAQKVIFCQGRLYYDLIENRPPNSAIIRIEQLYPFPTECLAELLVSYRDAKRFFWAEEEPKNMGPWNFVRDFITALLPRNSSLEYRGRHARSSPAVGSHKVHEAEQQQVIRSLLDKE